MTKYISILKKKEKKKEKEEAKNVLVVDLALAVHRPKKIRPEPIGKTGQSIHGQLKFRVISYLTQPYLFFFFFLQNRTLK